MNRFSKCSALAACAGLTVLHGTPLHAQAIDYGSLEQIFGEPITTSVTGKPQRASEVPGNLVIITHDDIEHSGADNIPDILQFVTGIDVRRYSFGDSQIAIRGYDQPFNPRLLVLVDGRQIYIDDYGYVSWDALPVQLDEIRQIEIVKGPSSALFGFNAASGVINIITYDPLLDKVNTATVRGGTQSYGAGDVVATVHPVSTVGVRVSLGGWTAGNYPDPVLNGSRPTPRYDSFNISARWQIAPKVLLRAEAGDTDFRDATTYEDLNGTFNTQERASFFRVGAAADTSIGTTDLDFYRNQALLNYGLNDSDNVVLVVKASDLIQAGVDNTVRLGVEYRNNSITGKGFGGRLSYNNYAGNAIWDWRISPILDLTNAVRLDHLALDFQGVLSPAVGRTLGEYNSRMITEPSFNSGLVIKATEQDTIRLTASRGLEIPSLIDFGLSGKGGLLALVGSPSVLPTAVWNTELGYDRAIQAIDGTLTSSVFFQRNDNLLSGLIGTPAVFKDGHIVIQSSNIGSSNEIGFEVGLNGKTGGGLRWNASYRYASITQDITSAVAKAPSAATSPDNSTPLHEIVAGLGYTLGKWDFDTQGRWQSTYTDYRTAGFVFVPVHISDYVTFNARIAYHVTHYLTLAGTGEQFNLSHLVESAGDYVDRRFIASAKINF